MKKHIISTTFAAAIFATIVTNVSAEGAHAVYIRTAPIPEHIREYAEFVYEEMVLDTPGMGFTPADDTLGAGFVAKDIDDGYDMVDDTYYVYYYPIKDTKGTLCGMLTISYDSATGDYGYTYSVDNNATGLNDLTTSYDDPAEIYMSDQVCYAVTDDETVVLSAYPPYSLNRLEELKQKLPEIRKENEKKQSNDVIVAFLDFETGPVTIDGKQYYIEENGTFASGWKDVKGKRYYFKKTGEALTGGAKIKGVYYTFNSDGTCKGEYTGWTKSAGKYHYYKQGKMLKYCWLTRNGERTYFFDKNGDMAVGETVIAGKTYTFSENGKLING